MFQRKRKVALTNDVYSRWLRAQRPPMDLFCGLTQIEQEQLAMLGDEYVQDVCVALGYANQHPRAAEAGLDQERGGSDGEAQLAAQLAKNIAAKILTQAAPKQAVAMPMPSGRRTLFGQRADEVPK